MIKPNSYLIEFHRIFCRDVAIHSPIVVIKLIEEIIKKEKERKNHEKQDWCTSCCSCGFTLICWFFTNAKTDSWKFEWNQNNPFCYIKQKITSIQVKQKGNLTETPIATKEKDITVGITVDTPVKKNDKLYKLERRN